MERYVLNLAQGKYIARMDADDICYPGRLQKQNVIMEESADIVVCGTHIVFQDGSIAIAVMVIGIVLCLI